MYSREENFKIRGKANENYNSFLQFVSFLNMVRSSTRCILLGLMKRNISISRINSRKQDAQEEVGVDTHLNSSAYMATVRPRGGGEGKSEQAGGGGGKVFACLVSAGW